MLYYIRKHSKRVQLVNIATTNRQIMYRENTSNAINGENDLKSLGANLTKVFMINRFNMPTLHIFYFVV